MRVSLLVLGLLLLVVSSHTARASSEQFDEELSDLADDVLFADLINPAPVIETKAEAPSSAPPDTNSPAPPAPVNSPAPPAPVNSPAPPAPVNSPAPPAVADSGRATLGSAGPQWSGWSIAVLALSCIAAAVGIGLIVVGAGKCQAKRGKSMDDFAPHQTSSSTLLIVIGSVLCVLGVAGIATIVGVVLSSSAVSSVGAPLARSIRVQASQVGVVVGRGFSLWYVRTTQGRKKRLVQINPPRALQMRPNRRPNQRNPNQRNPNQRGPTGRSSSSEGGRVVAPGDLVSGTLKLASNGKYNLDVEVDEKPANRAAITSGSGQIRLAVYRITFSQSSACGLSEAPETCVPTCSLADLEATLYTGPKSVARFYAALSNNAISLTKGESKDVTIAPTESIIDIVNSVHEALGYDPEDKGFTNEMFILPRNFKRGSFNKNAAGLGDLNGRNSWYSYCDFGTLAHELLHNAGLMHSGSFKPGKQTVYGKQIADQAGGDYFDYDDHMSVMGMYGHGYIGLAANQLERLGVLKSVQEITSSGQFTLRPLSTLGNAGTAAAVVRNSQLGDIWIEYRDRSGFDADIPGYILPASKGPAIVVHRALVDSRYPPGTGASGLVGIAFVNEPVVIPGVVEVRSLGQPGQFAIKLASDSSYQFPQPSAASSNSASNSGANTGSSNSGASNAGSDSDGTVVCAVRRAIIRRTPSPSGRFVVRVPRGRRLSAAGTSGAYTIIPLTNGRGYILTSDVRPCE